MAPPETLVVMLQSRPVGTIVRRDGRTVFGFLDAYVEDPDRPVLGQVFEEALRTLQTSRRGVPKWFDNLLPEEGSPLRGLIADRAGVHESQTFELLTLLGDA